MFVGLLIWLFSSVIAYLGIILFLDTFYIVSKELEHKGEEVKTFDDLSAWYNRFVSVRLVNKRGFLSVSRSYVLKGFKYVYLYFLEKQMRWSV